jgi:hypothetical protein
MTKFKIRVPNKEVSRKVQNKLFSEGIYWGGGEKRQLRNLSQPYLFVDTYITYGEEQDKDFFDTKEAEEISWQEFLYGEGYFFYCEGDEDLIYFHRKSDNEVVWICPIDNKIETVDFRWKAHLGDSWKECDMHGNLLEKEIPEEELGFILSLENLKTGMVVEYKSSVEETTFAMVLKGTKMGDIIAGGTWEPLTDRTLTKIEKVYSPPHNLAVSTCFNWFKPEGVVDSLENSWEVVYDKNSPEEMTLEQIEEVLGKKIRIV